MRDKRAKFEADYRFIMAHRHVLSWRTLIATQFWYAVGVALLNLRGWLPTHRGQAGEGE